MAQARVLCIMVVKTETCCFSEYKIYPGRGRKFAARDGKTFLFINHKSQAMFHQKVKPVRLTWTHTWRRMNKKDTTQTTTRRKNRKTTKFQKAIIGMNLDEIKKKKAQRPELRAAAAKDREASHKLKAAKVKAAPVKGQKIG